ncbi:efflux RND transporter periplasmic adaptor subunit [Pendulispora albinea]|uniref:Efflux RND transporter periplasmic adaptor subunit n=1 Tax=Pendulispora albinea TaxID=2741071 RepID=A0ABZ2LPS6_9BACT
MDRPIEPAMRTWRRKRALWAALAIALAASVALAMPMVRRWARAERVVDASLLRMGEVVRGDLERDVSVQGRVVAALHPTLYSPVQGTAALLVRAGTEVKKGQPLCRIESPELTSRLAQERATTGSLQAELSRHEIAARQAAVKAKQTISLLTLRLETSKRALRRATTLHDEGLINVSTFEKAQDDAEIAALELKNASETTVLEQETLAFEVHNRKLLLERQQSIASDVARQVDDLTVTAPFDGMVAQVSVQDRDAVNKGQALLSIVNLTAFEIELDFPENYATDVAMGTRAEIMHQGKPFAGHATAVSPQVKDGQVRATVVFDGDAPTGLRQSERLQTRLIFDRHDGVRKVPRGPFLESGGGRHVYVVQGGVAVRRPVQLGAVSVGEVEVVSGLALGERIIVSDTTLFQGAETVLIRE